MLKKSRVNRIMGDIYSWLSEHTSLLLKNFVFSSTIVAVASAYLRVMRDGSERTCVRIMQESAICGSLTLTISMGINALIIYFDVDASKAGQLIYSVSIFIGGFVGNLGSSFIRQMARKIVRQKIHEVE